MHAIPEPELGKQKIALRKQSRQEVVVEDYLSSTAVAREKGSRKRGSLMGMGNQLDRSVWSILT